ncbi:MAG TPA: hypothetical protein VFA55_10550 [Candidatus Kapabacteria bacterium]|nr:hypothetical protein [Candidatus Kapabacteria bacterium]
MNRIISFISSNPILLGVAIILISIVAYAVVKRLAKFVLFLLVLAAVAYFILKWLGKI